MSAEQRSDVALIGELGELLRFLDQTEMPLHLYQCASDATARLVDQAKEIARLRAELEKGDRDQLQTIDERDRFEDRVTEIARALGITEEWSSETDLGQLAVESAGSLRAEMEEARGRLVCVHDAVKQNKSLDLIRVEVGYWLTCDSEIIVQAAREMLAARERK